jgi:hypothetical protein
MQNFDLLNLSTGPAPTRWAALFLAPRFRMEWAVRDTRRQSTGGNGCATKSTGLKTGHYAR